VDETWRTELQEFLAIPSVSADPAHREDVKQAGEWVCAFIRRAGGTAALTPYGEKELALGEFHGDRLAGQLAVGEQPVERAFEIAHRIRAGIERGERIHKDDLAVEPDAGYADGLPIRLARVRVGLDGDHDLCRVRPL